MIWWMLYGLMIFTIHAHSPRPRESYGGRFRWPLSGHCSIYRQMVNYTHQSSLWSIKFICIIKNHETLMREASYLSNTLFLASRRSRTAAVAFFPLPAALTGVGDNGAACVSSAEDSAAFALDLRLIGCVECVSRCNTVHPCRRGTTLRSFFSFGLRPTRKSSTIFMQQHTTTTCSA